MGDLNDPYMRNRDAAVQARTKAQNRATVLQLKLIGQSHPTGLTNNLLKLFEPRPPLEYKPPPEKRKCPPYTGMAQFVSNFAEPGDPEYNPPVPEAETPTQRRARIQKLRMEKGALKAAEELQKYDPSSDPNTTGDPYKTLFVARLSYETSEHRLKREFEAYGAIKRIRIVTDKSTNKPRGYAFVEYVHTRDMKTAYKQADGRKIDNRRVLVDVERGRTVPNWRPRRLGGGLGSTRIGGGGEDANHKHLTRDSQQGASGGRPRSEEPRAKEDHRLDREKSRERGRDRDRDREKSRERSHDRTRDHDSREDRHHRDRERTKDRERDRGRDRERDRDRNRGRDKDHERDRRDRTRDRDYDRSGRDHDRERKYEKEAEYEQTYEKEQPSEKERGLDGGYEHAHQWHDNEHDRDYDNYDSQHDNKNNHYEYSGKQPQYEDGGVRYEHHEDSDPRRSLSREYDH